MSSHAHPRDSRPVSPGSKCWSSTHFQTKLVKSKGQLAPCSVMVLSQVMQEITRVTERDHGSKLWLFLLSLA